MKKLLLLLFAFAITFPASVQSQPEIGPVINDYGQIKTEILSVKISHSDEPTNDLRSKINLWLLKNKDIYIVAMIRGESSSQSYRYESMTIIYRKKLSQPEASDGKIPR